MTRTIEPSAEAVRRIAYVLWLDDPAHGLLADLEGGRYDAQARAILAMDRRAEMAGEPHIKTNPLRRVAQASALSPAPAVAMPEGWQPFNINSYVRVRLTETGIAALKDRHESTYAILSLDAPKWEDPRDADGWYKVQLWSLMEDLGRFCHIGATADAMAFATDIEISFPPASAAARPRRNSHA